MGKKNTKPKKKNIPAAKGEDIALGGFSAQYGIASELIIRALGEQSLERAIFKDTSAGTLDDIQIHTKNRIDAYQVKWPKLPDTLTKSNFFGTGLKKDEAFFKQLAEGWKSLKANNPEKEVFVHIYTNSIASKSSDVIDESLDPPRHLAEFIKDWNLKETLLPNKWNALITEIENLTGLSSTELKDFRKYSNLQLARRMPEEREEYDRDEKYYQDIENLQARLFQTASKTQGTVTLKKEEILELAGWAERFEFKSKHEFPTPSYYVPIEATVNALTECINKFDRGYLALLGSPGSGKSSLLTKTLRYSNEIQVIRYYCYVPNDSALNSRGEALNFLHDLSLTLWRENIRSAGRTNIGQSIDEIRSCLHDQIIELGNRWTKNRVKTIILLDGLDHIKREGDPVRSLLSELPAPDSLPEGVIFLLGSQRIESIELKSAILSELKENASERVVTMGKLSRRAIREVANKALPDKAFTETDLEKIEEHSSGHPLALSYILNRLKNVGSEKVTETLAKMPTYADNIEKEYEAFWKHLEENENVRELLAHMSRMRGMIDLKIISKLASDNDSTIRKLVESAKHYFEEIAGNKWKFFHNSFRQFILTQTGRNAFGIEDVQRHRNYHSKLAQLAGQDDIPASLGWDQVYHTYHGGKHRDALSIATQSYFREQYFNSRPIKVIYEDISLVMRSAKEEKDPLTVVRMLLMNWEFSARSDVLGEFDIPGLLMELGLTQRAIDYVLYEDALTVGEERGLKISERLAATGNLDLARQIFDAAEPLDRLTNHRDRIAVSSGEADELDAWVRAAIWFKPLAEIKNIISGLKVKEPSHWQKSEEEATKELQIDLILSLVDAVFDRANRQEIDSLSEILSDVIEPAKIKTRIAYYVLGSHAGDDWKKDSIKHLIEVYKSNKLHDFVKLRLAGILLSEQDNRNLSTEIFDTIKRPEYRTSGMGYRQDDIQYRFKYYRLSAALGKPFDAAATIPEAEYEHHKGDVLAERMLINLANLWVRAQDNVSMPSDEVIKSFLPIVRYYELRDDHDIRFAFSRSMSSFIEIFSHLAKIHSNETLEALGKFFDERWADHSKGKLWSDSIKRKATVNLFRLGGTAADASRRLHTVEPHQTCSEDSREFIESSIEHLKALIEIGSTIDAEKSYRNILESTFGIYHEKDSQMMTWAEWYARHLIASPEIALQDFNAFASGICSAADLNRGSETTEATQILIKAIAATSPRLFQEFKGFIWKEHVIEYIPTIEAMIMAGFDDEDSNVEIPFFMMTHLWLPYSKNFDSEVFNAFAKKLSSLDAKFSQQLLEQFYASIAVEVAETEQINWRSALRDALSEFCNDNLVGIADTKYPDDKPVIKYTPGKVTLIDGTVIEEVDLIIQARDPDKLIALMERADITKETFYNWSKVIKPIEKILTAAQLTKILDHLEKVEKGGRYITGLVERLIALGEVDKAKSILQKDLERSSSNGWWRYYDGGTRIEPYKTLSKLDEQYRGRALNQFIDDFAIGSGGGHLRVNLFDLATIFWKEPPIEALWSEIKQHIFMLREFSRPSLKVDIAKASLTIAGDLKNVLCEELFGLLDLPQPELRDDIYRAIIQIGKCDDKELHSRLLKLIQSLLDGVLEKPLLGMAVILGLGHYSKDWIKAVEKTLETHLKSDDIAIRLAASKTLGFIDHEVSIHQPKELPAFYSLDLPEYETMEHGYSGAMAAPGTTLPDTNDTLQLIGVAKETIDFLHRATGIPLRTLAERILTLMKKHLPYSEWNSEAERKLMNHVRVLSIETPFRRPRAFAAFTAIGYLMGELYDAEVIDDEALYNLYPALTIQDLKLSATSPSAKNLSPAPISLPQDYSKSEDIWLEEDGTCLDKPPITEDGWVIIGYETNSDLPTWSHPREDLLGGVSLATRDLAKMDNDPRYIFPSGMSPIWFLAEQYPSHFLAQATLKQSILIRGNSQRVEIGRGNWLAINPELGFAMGWTHDSETLFGWRDAKGNLVAESKYWQIGRNGRYPYAHGIRKEGWIVQISPSAFKDIQAKSPPLAWFSGYYKSLSPKEGEKTNSKLIKNTF